MEQVVILTGLDVGVQFVRNGHAAGVGLCMEDAKVLGLMASGDLTIIEGIEKLEQTTVASVTSIAVITQGAALGVTLGTVLGSADFTYLPCF